MFAVEGDGLLGGDVVGRRLAPEREAPAARSGGEPSGAGGRQQSTAGEGHGYPESARAGASDSGSASASITSLSRRTSGFCSAV